MAHRSSRLVPILAASVAAVSSWLVVGCGGKVEGAPASADEDASGAQVPSVCCAVETDGTLSCQTWLSSGPDTCPEGHVRCLDPGTCCEGFACTPADLGDGGSASTAASGAGSAAGACPVDCAAGTWPTPDGLGCCAVGHEGVECTEGSYPPVYEYPVAATFGTSGGTGVGAGPLACPEGSPPSADGLGCCTVDRAGHQVCGEYGASADLGRGPSHGGGGSTLGISWGGACASTGVCCPANTELTVDALGCCTVDSAGFTLCIRSAGPAMGGAEPGDGGGRTSGEPFFAGSVVPWPWGPQPVCPAAR